MRSRWSQPFPRLAGAAPLLIAVLAASCTTLLGVDGDYAVDPGGGPASGSGGGEGGAGAAGPTTTIATSTGAGASTGASGGEGGRGGHGGHGHGGDGGEGGAGQGGEAGASSSSSGGGGSGGVDCDEVLCTEEVLGDVVPRGARNPRLSRLTTNSATVTVLVGDAGFVWTGLTDGTSLAGAYPVGNPLGDDALRIGGSEMVLLQDGVVNVVQLEHHAVLGVPLLPPLFAARRTVEEDSTLYYVAGMGSESPLFACPIGGDCSEVWTGCAPVQGAPSHALSHANGYVVLGRVCGRDRVLRIDRNGAGFEVPDLTSVREVAVSTLATPVAFALTVQDEGPGRRVVMTRAEGQQLTSRELADDVPAALEPTLEATFLALVGAWVEDGPDGAFLRVAQCDELLTTCRVRRLHLEGAAAPDGPRRPTVTTVDTGALLAWEEGAAPDTVVRFARIPPLGGI